LSRPPWRGDATDARPIFKITVTGKNAAASKFTFGLDYLKFTPVP
jgi:hypothetical protein